MFNFEERVVEELELIDSGIDNVNDKLATLIEELRALRQSPPFIPSIISIDLAHVPANAFLAISLPPDVLDVDMPRIREELRRHLGDRKIMVYRAGDVKFGIIAFDEAPHED